MLRWCFLPLLVLLIVQPVWANPEGEKKAAQVCAMCHGPIGISMRPDAPHLAGQPIFYLVEQLKNYRDGKRKNETMVLIAKPLSDQDIDNLAKWYSSIRVEAYRP